MHEDFYAGGLERGEPNDLCGFCGKKPISEKCKKCGMPLCEECAKTAIRPNTDQMVLGVVTASRKPTETKIKVCPKCFPDVDLEDFE